MIDLDITLWVPVGELSHHPTASIILLIAPIRKIIRERKEKVAGLAGDIDAFAADGQKLLDNYEAELAKARAAANLQRKQAKADAEAESRVLLDAANADAQNRLRETQAAVRADADAAHKTLQAEMKGFADAALAKILG